MSNYNTGETTDLFDYSTGRWVGVLDKRGQETLIPTFSTDSTGKVNGLMGADGLVIPIQSANFSASGAFGTLRPVTNRQVFPEQNTAVLPGSVTTLTYRSRHTVQEDTPFIIVVWANQATPIGSSGNAVTYKASYDYAPAGTGNLNSIPVVPITLAGGQTSVSVPYGNYVQSDPIFGPFKAGDILLIRTNVTVADTAKKVPVGMTLNWGFEGTATGDATATANSGISFTATGVGVSPCAILGPTFRRPALALVGDSIQDGAGDSGSGPFSNLGPMTRAIEGLYGSIKVAAPGERIASAVATSGYIVRGIFANQCTHVVSNYGTNDLANGDTLATLQANTLTFAKQFFGGKPFYQQTLDPRTTSTDSWATTANQTLQSFESARQGFNTWLRLGAPIINGVAVASAAGALLAGQSGHPIAGVIDTASAVEVNAANVLTLNGGYWIVNGSANYPTSDGIHNSAAASVLKAAKVNTSLFLI